MKSYRAQISWLLYYATTKLRITAIILCNNIICTNVFYINSSIFICLISLSSSREVPRIKLPEELFVNIGVAIGAQVNKFLDLIQDISCGGNLKQFLIVRFLTLFKNLGRGCQGPLSLLYVLQFVVICNYNLVPNKFLDSEAPVWSYFAQSGISMI